jgi:periplasmic protein TonB
MSNPFLAQFERENRTRAAIYTSLIVGILFLILSWIKALEFYEIPEDKSDGFVVNFGTTDKGSGNIQTRNTPNPLDNDIESAPPAKEKPIEKEVVTPPKVVPKKVVPKPTPAPKVKVKPSPEPPIKTTTKESPVKVKEQPPAPQPSKKTPEPSTKPSPPAKADPTPTPPQPPAPAPQPKVEDRAIFKKGGNGTRGTDPRQGGNSNGDDKPGTVGDKGQPDGVDEKGIFKGKSGSGGGGNGGGGGSGASMALTGFKFSSRPQLNDPYEETGKIVFKIKVDGDGEIISLTSVESTVSQQVVNWYKQKILQQKIVPTTDGDRPEVSSGTIYINIVSK